MKKIVGAALLAACSTAAIAARPFATDDAGVMAQGDCEIETFYRHDRTPDSPDTNGWWVQPGCGLGFQTQLSLGFGQDVSDGARTTNVQLAGKTWIKELTEDNYGIALAYAGSWLKAPGESNQIDTTEVYGIVSVPLGAVTLHTNLGWTHSRLERVTAVKWGTLLEWSEMLGPLDGGIEVFGDDSQSPWLQIGLRWPVIKDRMNIDASWGKQTGDARGTTATLGLKFMF